jgi:malonate transporter MadL subunit
MSFHAKKLFPDNHQPMIIYGTALLSVCLLTGLTAGRLIGAALGVEADIGGVGIAMILLIVGCDALQRRGRMKPPTETGITFWGQMYVPIVVAMAASQNVLGALSGGVMALVAGVTAVGLSFVLVAALAKTGRKDPSPS